MKNQGTRKLNLRVQWILVAQRAGAKLYQSSPAGTHLKLLRDIPHPKGRLKDRDLISDKAGRMFSNQAGSPARSATDGEKSAHDHDAEVFALELARILDQGRTQNSYDQVVLVAEPGFLGKLQAVLSKPTADKVNGVYEKELTKMTEHELTLRLSSLMAA